MTTESYENYNSILTFNGVELGKAKITDYPESVMGTRSVTNHSSGGVAEKAPNGLITLGDVTLELIVVPSTLANLASLQSAKTIGEIEITNLINVWSFDGFVMSFKENPADANSPDTMTASVVIGTTGALTISELTEGEFANLTTKSYAFAPDLGTATYIHAAVTLGTGVETDVTTGITNPDFPRIVSVKGNQSTIASTVVITGTDFDNVAISESIVLNNATEVFGLKAFKTITNIHLPARTNVGDTVSIGVGNVFGMPVAIPNENLIFAVSFDGAADSAVINESATLSLSTVDIAGTPDGIKEVQIWYLD